MKKHLLGIAVAIATAGLVSLFTARRGEAQYSSPVRVMNSAAAPALLSSVDDHGRIPYQATVENNTCSGGACSFSLPSPPAGHRLVIERVGGFVGVAGATQISAEVVANGFVAFFDTPNADTSFEVPVLAYIDPGQLRVDVFPHGANISGGSQNWIIIKGYLLDCNAAPCAAIAP